MTRASTARLTTATGPGTAALEIIAGTLRGCLVRALDFSLAAATASVYGIGRPAAKGITPTTPLGFGWLQSADPPPQISATTALAWGTGPTVPASFFKMIGLPAVIGTAAPPWLLDSLFIPAGGSLVLWNIGTNSAAYVNITIDE